MRRLAVLLAVVASVLFSLLAPVRLLTGAQEGTPPADELAPPERLPFEALAIAPGVALPSPADIVVFRFDLDPGGVFPFDPADPSTGVVVVESGVLTFRIEAPITVTRAATIQATPAAEGPFAPQTEQVPVGTEFTLGAGDSAVFPANVGGEARNAGQDRAVALVTSVAPASGQGSVTGTPTAATPTT
ncbi:MAG: cupin domain-containing protein [Chloroflexota bacterium]|nr:cupin domain-containing protein [Chloroflexota bacterium]